MSRGSASHVVYVVDGARTPFLKAENKPGPFAASDLATKAAQGLLNCLTLSPKSIDGVVVGSVMSSPDETNIARLIALRTGCSDDTPAYTVHRNCASGLQALDSAMKDIQSGRHHLVLAGGTEAMSHAPLLLNDQMAAWLGGWFTAKSWQQRLGLLSKLRPSFLKPIIAILRGLNDPKVGLSMGQTAEVLAYRFNISREQMDEFAMHSHQRVLAAAKEGLFQNEIMALIDGQGHYYEADTGVREDSKLEKLAKLKPFFDKRFGKVTPGNSSQITDGAAMLLLASEKAVKDLQLPVLGKLIAVNWAGLDPREMGLGPVHATVPLLNAHNLRINDIDYWEINEAFAGQVLACLAAFNDETYCQQHFNMKTPFGEIPQDRLNIHGGAIALGHPVGASGARIVLQLLRTLQQKQAQRGVASLCIGGGQGGAIILERASKESLDDTTN